MNKFSKSFTFLSTLTFIGGFLDIYTFITRGGVFANTQTTNLAKLGYVIANNQIYECIQYILPIIACIIGGVTSTILVKKRNDDGLHKHLLLFEVLVFILVGLVRGSKYDLLVNTSVSFITSFQLNLFRKYEDISHNTTIMTGNLRQVGEFIANYLISRNKNDRSIFIKYTSLVSMFLLGAIVSVILTNLFMEKSIWICGILLLIIIKAENVFIK